MLTYYLKLVCYTLFYIMRSIFWKVWFLLSINFKNQWQNLLKGEFTKDYYLNLREFLKSEYATKTIYPDKNDIFNALHYTSYEDTKVVILGQDPYHGYNQAHGLSFSVQPGIKTPP